MAEKLNNTREPVSKRKLVESGKNLFFKYGFRKVTVEEVCQDARVSKMTFYRSFSNKTDLVCSIIRELADEGMVTYQEIMNRDIPFVEKVLATMEMKRESASQFTEEFLADIYAETTGDVMALLNELSGETLKVVLQDYAGAQESGQIRKELNLALIPYFTSQISRMINDPALLELYGGNMHVALNDLTGLFFYGILSPNRDR